MRELIIAHAPSKSSHRNGLGVVLAVIGVLAVGDAFHFIRFPMYTLGLPNTAFVNFLEFSLGAALFYTSFVLAVSADDSSGASGGATTAEMDAQELDRFDDLDPVHALKVRYAMGEVDDDAFARKLRALKGEDVNVDAHSVDRDRFEDVEDKQTIIDQVENRQTIID